MRYILGMNVVGESMLIGACKSTLGPQYARNPAAYAAGQLAQYVLGVTRDLYGARQISQSQRLDAKVWAQVDLRVGMVERLAPGEFLTVTVGDLEIWAVRV